MERFSVFVWVLIIAAIHSGRGSLFKSCQEICCSTSSDRTIFGPNSEKENNETTQCQECLRSNQSSDANVTQEQLCVKSQNKTPDTKKKTSTSGSYLFWERNMIGQIVWGEVPLPLPVESNQKTQKDDCQEMFDNASNNFVGIVTGVKVHFHRIENFWYINITWNALNDPKISTNWSHYAIQWTSTLDEQGGCGLVSKNQTFFIINETEHGWQYPYAIYLNVSTYPLKKNIGYRFEIEGRPIQDMVLRESATLPSKERKITPEIAVAIIGGSCAGIILIAVVVIVWKMRYPDGWRAIYRNRIKSLSENKGNFKYDASILYSSLDEQWVTQQLIPLLESENDFKCFIHFRDYEAGKVIHENMADSVYNCRKNLAVVSKNFLKSGYCQTELHMALERVNRCGDCSLIVINLDGVSIDKLPKGLRIRTFVNLTSSQEQKTWRKRLVKQISVEEDKQGSKIEADVVTSENCQVISHINDICSSSTENV